MIKTIIENLLSQEINFEKRKQEAKKVKILNEEELEYLQSKIDSINNKYKYCVEKTKNKNTEENKAELFYFYTCLALLKKILKNTGNAEEDVILMRKEMFKEELLKEVKKHYPVSLHKAFDEIITMSMYICLSIAVGEKVVIKSGEQKFDLRLNALLCAPPGAGKKFIADLFVKVAELLQKSYSKGGSTHVETFIGKNVVEPYFPFLPKNFSKNLETPNLFLAKDNKHIFKNIKIKGVLDQNLHIDEEFTKKIEVGTTKEEVFQYLNIALDPYGSNLLEKRLVDNSQPLKYFPKIVFTGCIQLKPISQDYYDLGLYRRCPILTGKKVHVKTQDSALTYSLNKALDSQRFDEIIKTTKKNSHGLHIKKKYVNDNVIECNIKDYPHKGNITGKSPNYSETSQVWLRDTDMWKVEEYSRVVISVEASFYVAMKINKLFDNIEKKSYTGTGFKNYLEWYFKTLFFKFAILFKISFEANIYSKKIDSMIIDEDDVKVVYNDIKKVFDNMFRYYEQFNNPEESHQFMLKKYGRNGVEILRMLQNLNASRGEAVPKQELYEEFNTRARKSYSTFHNSLKRLIDDKFVKQIDTGRREKGQPGILLLAEVKEGWDTDIDEE